MPISRALFASSPTARHVAGAAPVLPNEWEAESAQELEQARVGRPHPLAADVHSDARHSRGPGELGAAAPAVLRLEQADALAGFEEPPRRGHASDAATHDDGVVLVVASCCEDHAVR